MIKAIIVNEDAMNFYNEVFLLPSVLTIMHIEKIPPLVSEVMALLSNTKENDQMTFKYDFSIVVEARRPIELDIKVWFYHDDRRENISKINEIKESIEKIINSVGE